MEIHDQLSVILVTCLSALSLRITQKNSTTIATYSSATPTAQTTKTTTTTTPSTTTTSIPFTHSASATTATAASQPTSPATPAQTTTSLDTTRYKQELSFEFPLQILESLSGSAFEAYRRGMIQKVRFLTALC